LRRLAKRERPHARKAAREWRTLALIAVRDKRTSERHANRIRR
jgi:hypothetical protein